MGAAAFQQKNVRFILVNMRGTALTGSVENIITMAKIIILGIFIAYGLKRIFQIPSEAAADYDLIALGTSREGVFSNVLFGEIPEKVARYAHTPVMIVQRYEGPVKSLVKRVMG